MKMMESMETIQCLQSKIQRIHLIGDSDSKRYHYFKLACQEQGIDLKFWDIQKNLEAFLGDYQSGEPIKIDPPTYQESELRQLQPLIEAYKNQLMTLSQVEGAVFLNNPLSIWQTLDKKECKNILKEANIPMTPLLEGDIRDYQTLKQSMEDQRILGVFLKPRYGSGAAGVMAYKWNPRQQKEALETCLHQRENQFINTKKLLKQTSPTAIKALIEFILQEGAVIEHWIPKDLYEGKVYDLRAVYQFGHLDFLIGRGSAHGPITNLHLNNGAIDSERLPLSNEKKLEIQGICEAIARAFPGLQSFGVDILLTPKNQRPMVIEVNGQGDLLYKDIYDQNKIYKHQIQAMTAVASCESKGNERNDENRK